MAAEPSPRAAAQYCAATFQPGTALRRCSRCGDCWYASADAQRAHWRLHKAECRPLTEAERVAIAGATDLTSLWREIRGTLPCGTRKTAPLLRRLRALLDAGDRPDDLDDLEMEMHATGRMLLFRGDAGQTAKLWACPGMADIFLGEDMLSLSCRKIRAVFPLGLPSGQYIEHCLAGQAKQDAKQLNREDEDAWHLRRPGSCYYCHLYINLLLSAAVRATRVGMASSVHDGDGTLQAGPLAEAAQKKALALWCDPEVRRSCGDAIAPVVSFAKVVVSAWSPAGPLGAPGSAVALVLDRVVLAATGEMQERGIGQDYACSILGAINAMGKTLPEVWAEVWAAVGAQRRARLAHGLAAALHGTGPKDGDDDMDVVPRGLYGEILEAVCGAGGATRLEVCEAVATGEMAAPGLQDKIRAFFRYVQRRCVRTVEEGGVRESRIAPDLVANIYAGSEPTSLNMLDALEAWKTLRFPRQLTPEDGAEAAAGATEHMLCYKLVMDPALYAEWSSFFAEKADC
jgi:hypothetical protein